MFHDLKEKYKAARHKLILLDYDGTLVGFEPMPDRAKPTTQLLETLREIANQPDTELIVISGRRQYDIDKFLGDLPINIIAEHGAAFKINGQWHKQETDLGLWKRPILNILTRFTGLCPNSFIEEKEYSLTWHYRNALPETGYKHSRDLIHLLKESDSSSDLRIIDGNKIVEILNSDIDKGKAVINILGQGSYDYILSVGDDKTDEDMFRALRNNKNAYTIKVGDGETLAKYRLNSVSDVQELLEELLK